MSEMTFEPIDATLDDLLVDLPDTPIAELGVDQAEFDALIAQLAQDYPTAADVDLAQPEIDPQELSDWLDSLEPSSFDMDL